MEEILNFFPEELKEIIKKRKLNFVEEIDKSEEVINYLITMETILQILQKICENSIYSYQNQICEGFITLKGGHRVGITRKCSY